MTRKDAKFTIRIGADIIARLDADRSRYEVEAPDAFGRRPSQSDIVRLALLDYLERREKSVSVKMRDPMLDHLQREKNRSRGRNGN